MTLVRWLLVKYRQFVGTFLAFFVFRFIVNPMHGLTDIGAGMASAVPELLRATRAVVSEAIFCKLSVAGRIKVFSGLERITRGVRSLLYPAALVASFVIGRSPALVWLLLCAAAVFLTVVGLDQVSLKKQAGTLSQSHLRLWHAPSQEPEAS